MRIWSSAILMGILLAIILSCSGKLIPTIPDGPIRFASDFDYFWALWDSGLASIQYKNIDLSVLVNGGPEYDEFEEDLDYPIEIDGSHWTVATTIEKNLLYTPPRTSIKYAWLDDQDPDGPSPEAVTA